MTGHVRHISLAIRSRATRSSLRSGRDGGKNTTACGPRHAALVCHISSPRLAITASPRLAPRHAQRRPLRGASLFPARLDDVPHGRRSTVHLTGATSADLHKYRRVRLIATLSAVPTVLTRGSCEDLPKGKPQQAGGSVAADGSGSVLPAEQHRCRRRQGRRREDDCDRRAGSDGGGRGSRAFSSSSSTTPVACRLCSDSKPPSITTRRCCTRRPTVVAACVDA